MNAFGFTHNKQQNPATLTDTQYLVLSSEPADRLRKRRMELRYTNRLATKRALFRRIRRELQRQPGIWYEESGQDLNQTV